MKATEQYFPVVLFIMLEKAILTFDSTDEILKCDHSNESYWAVLSCGAAYYAVHCGSYFWNCGYNHRVWPFKWKLLSNTFLWYSLLGWLRWLSPLMTFRSCGHLNKKCWTPLFYFVFLRYLLCLFVCLFFSPSIERVNSIFGFNGLRLVVSISESFLSCWELTTVKDTTGTKNRRLRDPYLESFRFFLVVSYTLSVCFFSQFLSRELTTFLT